MSSLPIKAKHVITKPLYETNWIIWVNLLLPKRENKGTRRNGNPFFKLPHSPAKLETTPRLIT